jgi:hypothetical protein
MEEELKALFGNSITVNGKTIPTANITYAGSSKTYVTWTITGDFPDLSADDEQIYGHETADVDVYSDGNYLSIVAEIKRLMKSAGWIWAEDSPQMYETDTKMYHKTISFEKERNL